MPTNYASSASGATATATSTLDATTFPIASMLDGIRHTNAQWGSGGAWASNGVPSVGTPQEVTVDFGQTRTINEIDVFTLRDAVNDTATVTLTETCAAYGIKDFKTYYWDGSAWVQITVITNNTKVWNQITFSAVSTTKIKVSVTATQDGNQARIVEIEAYNTSAGGTNTTTTVDYGTVAITGQDVVSGGVNNTTTAVSYGTLAVAGQTVISSGSSVASPPAITSVSPLPGAQIGESYTRQLTKTGTGTGGAWTLIAGNLPDEYLSSGGLITIPVVGGSNYTFTVRYTDSNGYDQESFTIPVSEIATISFCHKRPLKRRLIVFQRLFTPIEGADEVAEDASPKYEFSLQLLYVTGVKGDELRQFLYDHRKREPFNWYNPDRDETRTVKWMNAANISEEELIAYGGFDEIILRDV